jgi:hypothetical protein
MSDKSIVGPGTPIFRALLRHDGKMVAGLASIPGGKARFFVLERRESDEAFIGRVSAWVKDQGGAELRMEPPDMLPQGVSVPEALLRITVALGVEEGEVGASEFDVANPEYMISPRKGS